MGAGAPGDLEWGLRHLLLMQGRLVTQQSF